MIRRYLLTLTLVIVAATTLFAQDGKIRGRVRDKESGEMLTGANITLEGTKLGGVTDANGEYIVLGVPPGVYTVRASLVGYAQTSISNVRVSANLTTTQDISLTPSAVQLTGVEITAERPLIQRNTTNTVRQITQEDIQNLPFRGVQNILALQAGVVQQDGELHVRGGRDGEVAYYVDGSGTTNPIFNSQNVDVIQDAIEEVQLQAGGYTAEHGGSNSAIAKTTLKSGGTSFSGSIGILTDDLAKPGEQFLNTSAFGRRVISATIGGPLFGDLKFFVAGQHNYVRNRQIMFLEPFSFDTSDVLRGDVANPYGVGTPLPAPLIFERNYIPNNYLQINTVQGTLSYDLDALKLRLTGSYQADEAPFNGGPVSAVKPVLGGTAITDQEGGGWPAVLVNYYNQRRTPVDFTKTWFANMRATYLFGTTTTAEVGFSLQQRNFSRKDPTFGEDWTKYVDSAANAAAGFTGWTSAYQWPQQYSVIDAFNFNHENTPNNTFNKNKQFAIGGSADVTSQLSSSVEIKLGGRFESWTTRSYQIGNIRQAMTLLYGADGRTPRVFSSPEARRIALARGTGGGNINHYGYDVDGNEVGSGVDGPRKPLFISGYAQSKFEYNDLVINLGVRFERYDTKNKTFADPTNPPFIDSLDVIDESKLVDQEPFNLFLPRVSFSFPVSDKTVFYAMYGKYAQLPSLNQQYVGNTVLSRTVSPITRGNAFLTPVGFLTKPERTTQYEMGFRQVITDNVALTLTGFYKNLEDQLQVRTYVNPTTGARLYTSYQNEDFGTVKGLESTIEVRRYKGFAAKFTYTLSDAQGTGSNARAAFGAIEQNIGRPTNFINPLEFNQTHRGTLLLDYRWGKDEGGPILEGVGLNLLATFNSGHSYTKVKEPTELGQASQWNVGVEPLNDPRSSFPVEPINASKTPWVFNLDLNVTKTFFFGGLSAELYVNVLNLLDAKNVINVYPTTGTAQDDGWLGSPAAVQYAANPAYVAFYKAINSDNRWAYMQATGNDLYGSPRQIRIGTRLVF
jgi:hypothetical protein